MRNLLILFLTMLAAAVAGCGGDDEEQQAAQGKRGGTLTVISQGDVDSLDPGYAYYQYDYMALTMPGHRSLYGWRPNDTKPTPDLADGMPQLSNGGRTVTIKLKPNVRFSPPVNRAATAADVKYAMERLFLPQVGNGYAGSYLSGIEGVKEFTDGDAKEISGIKAPDPTTLVLELDKPTAVIANGNVLALPGTAPVPKGYAQKYDRGKQSTYGQHAVYTGPYWLRSDRSGKVTKQAYQPGKRIVLERNPNWDARTDFRPAYADRIVFQGGNDLTVGSRRILNGRGMLSGDYAAPPTAVLKQAVTRFRDQTTIVPSQGVRYLSLNASGEPFDDANVRRAVAASLDREALRLTRGGEAVGDIATHFIPPGMPGFEEAGGEQGPGVDFYRNPKGDPALAAEYMRRAGFESGRYEGRPLLMVGDDEPPASKTGEAIQSQLEKLGFRFNYRQVPHETMLSKFCTVPKADVAICPNMAWGKDFYDPQSMIDPVFNGENIVPSGNVNTAEVDEPDVNKAIEEAKAITDPAEAAKAWGELDRKLTGEAYYVTWLWDSQVNLRSKNVNGVVSKFNSSWDVTYTSLR